MSPMRPEDSDRNDDLINPLTPWASMALIFVVGWGVVLLDALDVPGRYGRGPGLNRFSLLLPVLAVAGYWVFWMAWRLAERRQRRRSRARRAMLGHDRQH